MIRTRRPAAPRAVPRLMAVVVLPTPPFWLATAWTLTWAAGSVPPDLGDVQKLSLCIAEARIAGDLHCPVFARPGQFARRPATLEEQQGGARVHVALGQGQEIRQGCQRARRDHVGRERRDDLDPLRVHRYRSVA